MSINVTITEKDGIYKCESKNSDNWFRIYFISEYYKDLKLKKQYSINRHQSKIFYDEENILKITQPDTNTKKHFTAQLKKLKQFIEVRNKPEPKEFDGYITSYSHLYSKIRKAKIKVISNKKFTFKEAELSFWQTASTHEFVFIKANPKLDKLYEKYTIAEKIYNLSEQKLKKQFTLVCE